MKKVKNIIYILLSTFIVSGCSLNTENITESSEMNNILQEATVPATSTTISVSSPVTKETEITSEPTATTDVTTIVTDTATTATTEQTPTEIKTEQPTSTNVKETTTAIAIFTTVTESETTATETELKPDNDEFPTKTGTFHQDEARSAFDMINEFRKENGIPELIWDTRLEKPSKIRATEISIKWSHTRPDGEPWHTASELMNGENIAKGYPDAESVVTGWMTSPGHRANILNPEFKIGYIGCVEFDGVMHWASEFGF